MMEIKQPSESRIYPYDFTSLLGGETIAAISSATAVAKNGGTSLTKINEAFSGAEARVQWAGGANGETYLTTVVVTDSAGQTHEIEGEISVVDLTFSLPSGITSTYITAEEYVARYGLQETITLTDTKRTGTVDAETLGAALSDATMEIEGALAGRYAVPLSPVPALVKRIAGDLTRAYLTTYEDRGVETKAKDARARLKDIAGGTLLLPLDTVTQTDVVGSVQYVAPARLFTSDSLPR